MKIDRPHLLAVLEAVAGAVARRPSFEQAHCLVFDQGKVCAFDGELFCCADSPVDVQGAVPAKTLLEYLRKITEEEINLTHAEGVLRFSSKRFRLTLACQQEILLPVSQVETPPRWHQLPEDALEALALAASCTSEDERQFEAACVNVTPTYVEAYDGEQTLRHELTLSVEGPFLLGRRAVKEAKSIGVTRFALSPRWCHFDNPAGFRLSALRYVGVEYPDLAPCFVPGGEEFLLPPGLETAAELACLAAKEADERALLDVTLRQGEVRIKGVGVTASYEERRKADYDGPELRFRIAAGLLADVARGHKKVFVTENRLLVEGGKWAYAARLSLPEEKT